MSDSATAPQVIELGDIGVRRSGEDILRNLSWVVGPAEHWVLLGPNGSGKTTLARVASLWEHPSCGEVSILGETLGHTDVRTLRRRIAFVSSAMVDMVRPALSVHEVVLCGVTGALEPWWHDYSEADHDAARSSLAQSGLAHLGDRRFGTLSSGERQRVLLARAHVANPSLVILDEPNAGLDLGGREQLVDDLVTRTRAQDAPPTILVTHHVEEIPPSFTHLLALRKGEVVVSGPIKDVLSAEMLSETFGVDVLLDSHRSAGGTRWSARRRWRSG